MHALRFTVPIRGCHSYMKYLKTYGDALSREGAAHEGALGT